MAASMILVGVFLLSKWGQGKVIFTIIACYIAGLISCGVLYGVHVNLSTLSSHLAPIFLIPMVAAAGGMMYSILAANIARYTKKTVTGTLFFSAYCVANIVSPQTFLSTQAPKYTTGVFVALVLLSSTSFRFRFCTWSIRGQMPHAGAKLR